MESQCTHDAIAKQSLPSNHTYTLVLFLNIVSQLDAWYEIRPELQELAICATASVADWALDQGYAIGLYANTIMYMPEMGMSVSTLTSPVLVIGFGGRDAVLTNFTRAQPPEIGWSKRIILLTETNYTGTVTLHGAELHDGTPIWFGIRQHSHTPITTFTVLPLNSSISNHTGSDEEWGLSTATMYISRAGCNFLMATWPEGGWIVFFSAGR